MKKIELTDEEFQIVLEALDLASTPADSSPSGFDDANRAVALRDKLQSKPKRLTEEEVAKLPTLAMLQRLTHVVMALLHARPECPFCHSLGNMPCTLDCYASVTINGILAAKPGP